MDCKRKGKNSVSENMASKHRDFSLFATLVGRKIQALFELAILVRNKIQALFSWLYWFEIKYKNFLVGYTDLK